MNNKYQVIVVGAGHAGCEAALAAARIGMKTALFTLSLDNIARMSCNPSLGGPAKGHIVKEIDALGGEMAYNSDKTFLQMRVLNTKKGPAVRALRAQSDKTMYHLEMRKVIENQKNLFLIQGNVSELILDKNVVKGVKTKEGLIYEAESVVLATGTFMRGLIHIGSSNFSGGRAGEPSSEELPIFLENAGIELGRFKTGTPPRINKNSIDFSKLIIQEPDREILKFSSRTKDEDCVREQLPCYLTHTNTEIHNHVLANLDQAPLYNGQLNSKGPRYCPSFEDKVVKFADKDRHQVFLEPESMWSNEIYLNGLSTSLPASIQENMVRKIIGLEKAEFMRYGYAVEYDYIKPEGMKYSLESKKLSGLFFSGQINGTTGYEEAAASGLIAGINASLKILGKEPLILSRDSSYIGMMIDDLITKGTVEPYRVLTARSEYRLLLREDNADVRLTKIGYEIGLQSREELDKVEYKVQKTAEVRAFLKKQFVNKNLDAFKPFLSQGENLKEAVSLEQLMKRPDVTYEQIREVYDIPKFSKEIERYIETEIKYEGYIKIQSDLMEKQKSLQEKRIPEDFDFSLVNNISIEARERMKRVRPINIGQASRISGVNPSDISFLIIYLTKKRDKKDTVSEEVKKDNETEE